MLALSQTLVADTAPLSGREKYLGLLAMMWALSSVSWPVAGGAFMQEVSWRWVFYLSLPFYGAGFVLLSFVSRFVSGERRG